MLNLRLQKLIEPIYFSSADEPEAFSLYGRLGGGTVTAELINRSVSLLSRYGCQDLPSKVEIESFQSASRDPYGINVEFHDGYLMITGFIQSTNKVQLSRCGAEMCMGGWRIRAELAPLVRKRCGFMAHKLTPEFLASRSAEATAEFEQKLNDEARKRADDMARLDDKMRLESDNLGFLNNPLPDGKIAMAHQRWAIAWLLARRKGILADDMGLGKTLTAIMAAKIVQDRIKAEIIVVCPVSLIGDWEAVAKLVGAMIKVYSWAKIPTDLNKNYVAIFDEAHYAQGGNQTKRGKRFIKAVKSSYCVAAYMLTGTPISNSRPINMYPLLHACGAYHAATLSEYEDRYCGLKSTRHNAKDNTGHSNLDELAEFSKPWVLRRVKRECLDLPKFTRIMASADVSNENEQAYKNLMRQVIAEKGDGSKIDIRGKLVKVLQAASIAKIPHAIKLARELIEEGNKVVIFSRFREPVRMIAEEFGAASIEFHGDVKMEDRKPLQDQFNSDPTKMVWVSTSQAGGVGLNLAAANYCILIDRDWKPGEVCQCEARIDRMTQTQPCTSYWIRYGIIDERMDKKLSEKADRIQKVLSDKNATIDSIDTYEEIEIESLYSEVQKSAKQNG